VRNRVLTCAPGSNAEAKVRRVYGKTPRLGSMHPNPRYGPVAGCNTRSWAMKSPRQRSIARGALTLPRIIPPDSFGALQPMCYRTGLTVELTRGRAGGFRNRQRQQYPRSPVWLRFRCWCAVLRVLRTGAKHALSVIVSYSFWAWANGNAHQRVIAPYRVGRYSAATQGSRPRTLKESGADC